MPTSTLKNDDQLLGPYFSKEDENHQIEEESELNDHMEIEVENNSNSISQNQNVNLKNNVNPRKETSFKNDLFTPSLSDIKKDEISKLASVWGYDTQSCNIEKFDLKLVDKIYVEELEKNDFPIRKVMLLEYTHYLENYLWPNFQEESTSLNHILSIVILINEKFRQKFTGVFEVLTTDSEKFSSFFRKVLELLLDEKLNYQTRCFLLIFLINSFSSQENEVVRSNVLKLVSISIWNCLVDEEVMEKLILTNTEFVKRWAREEKKFKKADEAQKKSILFQRSFLSKLIKDFLNTISTVNFNHPPKYSVKYCERFLELLIDLESQLSTHKYFNFLMSDHLVLQLASTCSLASKGKSQLKKYKTEIIDEVDSGVLFVQLLARLELYTKFEVYSFNGTDNKNDPTSYQELVQKKHYSRFQSFQQFCYVNYRESLEDFGLSNVGSVDTKDKFFKIFIKLDTETLRALCKDVGIRVTHFYSDKKKDEFFDNKLLVNALIFIYAKKDSQIDVVNSIPLYPDEDLLFDETLIPSNPFFSNSHCLAAPKLNLQFLSAHDYLLRNFTLFRYETAHEIRQDIEDCCKRMQPKFVHADGSTIFNGWSRMGLVIEKFSIVSIGTPKLGETNPSFVKADITFDLSRNTEKIRREWDTLRPHDVLFLISVQRGARLDLSEIDTERELNTIESCRELGVKFVRGCEILNLIGENGKVVDEFHLTNTSNAFALQQQRLLENSKELDENDLERLKAKMKPIGSKRTYRVSLDVNQYVKDMELNEKGVEEDVYAPGVLNIVMRRKAKENNFKPVLETIRDLIRSSEIVVPIWLNQVLLGYGDPSQAQFTRMSSEAVIRTIDFRDTFLNWSHLEESFPGKKIVAVDENDKIISGELSAPYILTFPKSMFVNLKDEEEQENGEKKGKQISQGVKRKLSEKKLDKDEENSILVRTYQVPYMGPYLECAKKKNAVKFTPTQVEAIHSGSSPGLTMIVGPPGTGKTDVAVQIIANIYHNFPSQHTLLITHSNQALNQLFEKIAALDIDPRHLLRLGHGEEELEIEGSGAWGKYGRVNAFLEKRIELLAEVDRLAASLNVEGAHGNSCETAGYFFTYHVASRWNSYTEHAKSTAKKEYLVQHFPFYQFFSTSPTPHLFTVESTYQDALEVAEGCFRHIKLIFTELEEIRAFELLRSGRDRSNYLLVKEAKIVALTCTHAALKRRELVRLGFKYDNVVMEESAQILEVETFIPLLLQSPDTNFGESSQPKSRLQRVVLIGDHHQLPPVVQNGAFQRYGNMEQSLFTRFVRLGVPTIQLDRQGRAKSSLAEIFRWNYKNLGDLDIVKAEAGTEFSFSNPGFAYDYQVIDVPDYFNTGETEPIPHFYQNLGEAEYVVATFMYMRLLGYPAEKISILTTYNGQKELIKDILQKKCSWNPLFGKPQKVSTVDRFQGQQNDYILLSLVRTKSVGHFRDVRRLIVAMSRSRLGLLVFCRLKLFGNCVELKPAFDVLLQPRVEENKLHLKIGEKFGDVIPLRNTLSKVEVGEGESKKTKKKGKKSSTEVDEEKTSTADNKSFKIEGVQHLMQYVYDMTQEQIAWLRKQKEEAELLKRNAEEALENENEDKKIEEMEKNDAFKNSGETNDNQFVTEKMDE